MTLEKAEIRRYVLRARSLLTLDQRTSKDARIAARLERLKIFRESRSILLYCSFRDEVNTRGLLKKWIDKKQIYLPRLTSEETFIVLPVAPLESLEVNRFGIAEPELPKKGFRDAQQPQPLDLIIVPGVAFDRQGNRIGMGKGYYDRFLSAQKGALRVALAYSEQVLDQVPHKPYDEPVDMIITEDEVIRRKVSP